MSVLEINYDQISEKHRDAVRMVDAKPHVRYIRYLMTKRYSTHMIREELQRMALSTPSEALLKVYYLSVVDPAIKQFGLGALYSEYKSKLMQKTSHAPRFQSYILNYNVHLGEELDLQPKFHKLVRFLEIEEPWLAEILKFHGTVSRFPVDEDGVRILRGTGQKNTSTFEKVMLHPKRYMLDKMILESIPNTQISEVFRNKYDTNLFPVEIEQYKRTFFHIKTMSVEDRIRTIEVERNSLGQFLKDIAVPTSEFNHMGIGERMVLRKQSEQRVQELDESLKILNAIYSESAHGAAMAGRENILSMFTDVMLRGYERFCHLDHYKDREVVDPLIKIAKMMSFSHDKMQQIEAANLGGRGSDPHSQEILMELYQKRVDEMTKEEAKNLSDELKNIGAEFDLVDDLDINDIDGIEEVGASFEEPDEEE